MNRQIAAIVEGPGEENAVPSLVRRILQERLVRYDIEIPRAKVKVAKGKGGLKKRLESYIGRALVDGCAAILVLLDADNDCPLELASDLSARASALNAPVPIAIVCAKSEYETWFICSLSNGEGDGIRRRLDMQSGAVCPDDPESIRNAKDWLENFMPSGRAYRETSDQDNLTHHIAIDAVHAKSRSFRRLCNAVQELVDAVDSSGASAVTPSFGGYGAP